MPTNLRVLGIALGVVCILGILYVSREQSSNNPYIQKILENFAKIKPEYGKVLMVEGEMGKGTYTENKRRIVMCLKNPATKDYYEFNTIMYVALHELAHVITVSHGHTDEFHRNFHTLLERGKEVGIYTTIDHPPPTYCV